MPGESTWFKASPETSSSTLASGLSALSLGPASPTAISTPHNAAVQLKYPLPSQRAYYLGALIKVYDDSAAFRPASAHTFVGVVSRAALPAAGGDIAVDTGDEDVEGEEDVIVSAPAIHVLAGPYASTPTVSISAGGTDEDVEGARSEVVRYLTGILDGDDLAAEYLLLTLLSRPAVRPPSLPPLGTLSLNFISPPSPSNLLPALRQIVPAVVDVPLTIPYLHETAFIPSAPTSTSLNAGLLQLAPDTMLIIDETNIGDGGKLEERAVKNLQAVQQCLNEQKVGYAYPYVPELKMECAVRGLVLSEGGRGIVRADVSLPVRTHPRSGASIASKAGEADQAGDAGRGGRAADMPVETLQRIRAYLLQMGGEAQAKKLSIPDKVGDVIQDAFVSMRAAAQAAAGAPGTAGTGEVGDAEGALKRRMRIARYVLPCPLLSWLAMIALILSDCGKRMWSMDTIADSTGYWLSRMLMQC